MSKEMSWTDRFKKIVIEAGRLFLWAALMALALGIVGLSVYLSWQAAQNWFGTNAESLDLIVFGVAGVDLVKAFLVVVIAALWSRRHRALAGCLALVLGATTLASIQATYSVFAIGRTVVVGTEAAERTRLNELRKARAADEQELAKLPTVRPVAMIIADLKAIRVDRRWGWTEGCTKATSAASRSYCKVYHKVEAELAGANRVEILRGRIENLSKSIIDRMNSQSAADTAVDLKAIERLTGLTSQGVIEARAFALAVIIELMSITLIAAAWRIRPWRDDPASAGCVEQINEGAGATVAEVVATQAKTRSKQRRRKTASGPSRSTVANDATEQLPKASKSAAITSPTEQFSGAKVVPLKAHKHGSTEQSPISLLNPPYEPSVTSFSDVHAESDPRCSVSTAQAIQLGPITDPLSNVQLLQADDIIDVFVSQCVKTVVGNRVAAAEVWSNFQVWTVRQAISTPTRAALGRRLAALGLKKSRGGQNGSVVYNNIALES